MFEDIIGLKKEKELFINFLENDNISHAYLFSGKKGIGKAKFAKEFAKRLLKVDNLESSPDFKYITKREDKKDILVEQIRKELIDNVYIVPAAGDRKVYIINDAESLNIASQNTLLKTLEEPPKYITIILVSSNISAFLTTILSRVTQIPFEGISSNELKQYIYEKYNLTFNDNILEYINGSIGKAEDIIKNNLLDKFNAVDELYSYLNALNTIKVIRYSSNINFALDDLLDYLEYILYKNNKYECVKIVENAKNRLKFNGNYDIIIDSMLLRFIDSIKEAKMKKGRIKI